MKVFPLAWRVLGVVLLGGAAIAADHQILGRRLLVGEKASGQRLAVVQGKENPSGVPYTGDLLTLGASLDVVANGGSPSTQTFALPAAGWSQTGTGAFRYSPPSAADPVRRVRLKLTGTSALLSVVIRGSSSAVQVMPPNPGDDGGIALQVGGGDRYCVSLGGAAGGTESRDDGTRWKITGATAAPGCPVAVTTTTTSTTVPFTCGGSGPACGGTCPAGYNCEEVDSTGTCFCYTGGSGNCSTCDTPCDPGDVCGSGIQLTPPNYQVTCECVTPPVCGGSMVCSGSCPTGFSCEDLSPGVPTNCGCVMF